MSVRRTGIEDEHRALRGDVGAFDAFLVGELETCRSLQPGSKSMSGAAAVVPRVPLKPPGEPMRETYPDLPPNADHDRARVEGVIATSGVTRGQLGELLVADGAEVTKGEARIDLGSAQAVSGAFPPPSGRILAVSDAAAQDADATNASPREAGRLVTVVIAAAAERDDLPGAVSCGELIG